MSATTDSPEVRLEKVDTRMGYRLEVRSTHSGSSIRIDPLGLEGLSWQDFDELTEDTEANPDITLYKDGEPVTPPQEIRFRNEYALALVDVTDDSVEISSPKIGFTNQLTGEDLSWLSEQTTEILSEFLENPLGPD
ncbi:hypothetical protein [Halobellus sp. GM3]|uniref:hypothetical protein n=1 Tax=Halobellus sp. GM3 TaxID=3458410 RepID=UPI00403DBA72